VTRFLSRSLASILDTRGGKLAICRYITSRAGNSISMFPKTGEVDIIEGVHDNEHNQVTFHTAPGIRDFFFSILPLILGTGCSLNPNATFTGTVAVSQFKTAPSRPAATLNVTPANERPK